MKNVTILAYSGGLDTSAIIPWLIENYDTEVIAYCCDLGSQPEAERMQRNSLAYGAKEFVFEDLKEVFCTDYVFPMLRSGAKYQEDYLLGTAIARPLISERIAHCAQKHGAQYICHGATGKGNDHIRFEKSWAYLVPEVQIIAPWKTWKFKGRTDLVEYLKTKGFEYKSNVQPQYSVDTNLLHLSTEGGRLENIGVDFDESDVFQWTKPEPTQEETKLSFEFKNGIPVKMNAKEYRADDLLDELNQIGGKHGIGVVDLVEERANGIKSRGIYETPGGTILSHAIKQLKQICWSRKLSRTAQILSQEYGQLIYDGDWHSLARNSIEAFFKEAGQSLTGEVDILLKGSRMQILKRESVYSVYNPKAVSFESDQSNFNEASKGYTQFVTHPSRLEGRVRNQK